MIAPPCGLFARQEMSSQSSSADPNRLGIPEKISYK